MNAHIRSEPNGSLVITTAGSETTVTIQPDGTVSVSALGPVQLVGATLGKLDAANIDAQAVARALLKRAKA